MHGFGRGHVNWGHDNHSMWFVPEAFGKVGAYEMTSLIYMPSGRYCALHDS